jgi:hypothetical protein
MRIRPCVSKAIRAEEAWRSREGNVLREPAAVAIKSTRVTNSAPSAEFGSLAATTLFSCCSAVEKQVIQNLAAKQEEGGVAGDEVTGELHTHSAPPSSVI